jgi:CBS domain-containing protein
VAKEIEQISRENIVVCPDCGEDNIEGADLCWNCNADLRSTDVPGASTELNARLLGTTVSEINLGKAAILEPGNTILEATRLMQEGRTGCVVVVDQGELAGVFTERDLLLSMAAGDDLGIRQLRDVMTPNPLYLRLDTNLAHAVHQMSVGGYRHIPVLDGDSVVGIVSLADIFQFVYDVLAASPKNAG